MSNLADGAEHAAKLAKLPLRKKRTGLGDYIRGKRNKERMTLRDVADKLRISEQGLQPVKSMGFFIKPSARFSEIERGAGKLPSIHELRSIKQAIPRITWVGLVLSFGMPRRKGRKR